MTTHTSRDDQLPTTGPDSPHYGHYRYATTGDGNAIIYHATHGDRWIESDTTVTLEEWH